MSDGEFEQLSDEGLVTAFVGGQGGAFRFLTQRYERTLFNYLLRMLGSSADADDAFQETFLRVFRALPRFETGRSFKPWLFTIAGNLVKNVYRSRSLKRKLSLDRRQVGSEDDGEDLLASLATSDPGPFEAAARGERGEIIREALEALPAKGRQALVLFYFEGFSYEEIAEIEEVPLGTVKSRIHNATAKLVAQLGQHEDGLRPDSLRE